MSISKLVLHCCTFTKHEMRAILDACAALKGLNLTTDGYGGGPAYFTTPELVGLLMSHKTTLEELTLDLHDRLDFELRVGYLTNLRDFTALKKIDVWTISFGDILLDRGDHIDLEAPPLPTDPHFRDRLPCSLQHLVLRPSVSDELCDVQQIIDVVRKRNKTCHRDFKKLTFVGVNNCSPGVERKLLEVLGGPEPCVPDFTLDFISMEQYKAKNQTVFTRRGRDMYNPRFRFRDPIQTIRWRDGMYVSGKETLFDANDLSELQNKA
jgi:hypothetical protein